MFLVRQKYFNCINTYDIYSTKRETKIKHSHQQENLGSKERQCPAQKQQNTEVSVSYQQENNKPEWFGDDTVHIIKAMFQAKFC
jgi:hypothetical protein